MLEKSQTQVLHNVYASTDTQIKEGEMGGTCRTHNECDHFSRKFLKEITLDIEMQTLF
jgi:hypothetical protein